MRTVTVDARILKSAAVAIAGVVVLAAVYFFVFARQTAEYSVVYLSSGEVYIGRLSAFPRFTLTDGYIFQAVPDSTNPAKSTFQLSPLKDALWAPQYLYLNQDQVLFYGPLAESSAILQTLKNPTANTTRPATPQIEEPQ